MVLPRWSLAAVAAAGLLGTAVFAFLYVQDGSDSDDPLAQWKMRAVQVLLEEERLYDEAAALYKEFSRHFDSAECSTFDESKSQYKIIHAACATKKVPDGRDATLAWDALILTDMAYLEGQAPSSEGRVYMREAVDALHAIAGCRAWFMLLGGSDDAHCPSDDPSNAATASLSRLYGYVGLSGRSTTR
jgi:hypothetical protein